MATPSERFVIATYTDMGFGRAGIGLYNFSASGLMTSGDYSLDIVSLAANGTVKSFNLSLLPTYPSVEYIIINSTFYDFFDITNAYYYNEEAFFSSGDVTPDVVAVVLRKNGVIVDVLGDPAGPSPLLSEPGAIARNSNFAAPPNGYLASDWNVYKDSDLAYDYYYLTSYPGAVPPLAPPTPPVSLAISGFGGQSFQENALNAYAEFVGAGITLSATGVTDFAGGTLKVAYKGPHGVDDHLLILDQGTSAGQIGFANGTVTFGGVAIATATGGGAGTDLTVNLNANATPAIVGALLRALAYRNSDDTPDATRTLTISLSDGKGHSAPDVTAIITIVAENDAPSIGGTGHANVAEGQAVAVTTAILTGIDPDDAPAGLTYTVSDQMNGQVVVNGVPATVFTQADLLAGRVTFAHDGSRTTSASFKVFLADGGEDSAQPVETTVTIAVSRLNHAPVAADKTVERLEDAGAYTLQTADFGFSDPADADAPNGLKAVIIETIPAHGTLSLDGVVVTSGRTVSAVDIAAGKLTFDPGTNESGSDFRFGFRVVDDGGTALGGDDTSDAVNHITFAVKPVNDAPMATNASFALPEDGSWLFQPDHFGFSDMAEGSAANALLSLIIDRLPTGGKLTLGSVDVVAGQEIPANEIQGLRYVPDTDVNGPDTFAFRVRDDGGTANGGFDVSAQQTITLTVTPINDAPQGTDARVALLEDETHAFSTVDFGFFDPKDVGDQLASVILTELPVAGTLRLAGNPVAAGTPIAVADLGLLAFTPAANASGVSYARLKFKVQDDGGTANGGADTSTEHTLVIDVTAVNDAPVITGVATALPIGDNETVRPFSTAVLRDVDSTSLTVTISLDRTDLGAVSRATGLRANADGTYSATGSATLVQSLIRNFTFDPTDNKLAPGLVGTTRFTLSLSDGTKVATTDVDVQATSINDRPVAVSDGPISVDEGAGYSAGAVRGVLSNDTDADRDALTVSEVKFNTTAGAVGSALMGTYGTLVLNADGSYIYIADRTAASALFAGQFGTDAFTYTVSDGNGGTTTGTLSFKVNGTTLLVEGLELAKRTVANPDGSLTQTIAVPVVPDGGPDGVIDVPVANAASGQALLTATVPTGVGMQISGSPSAKPGSGSLTDLLNAIQDRTPAGSVDQQVLTDGARGFLASLPANGSVLVQTVDIIGAPVNGQPISISGSAAVDSPKTAVVVDASELPSGTLLKIDNVDFVMIIGAVRVTGGAGSQVLWGDSASQWLVLGAEDDTLHGGGGDDYVGSLGGHDWLYGDAGNDTVSGGAGDDHLFGGDGQDVLLGGIGRDWLEGNSGNDRLLGEAGNDRLSGGDGNDHLLGGTGRDRLDGGEGKDRLDGEAGHDTLLGGAGNDLIRGGAGNDWIRGGLGRDKMWGGAGADIFDFDTVEDSQIGLQRDVIHDFQSGLDRVDLRTIDANVRLKGNQAFSWVGAKGPFQYLNKPGVGFSGTAGELRYANGILMGDVDGNGTADFQIKIVGSFAVGDVIL